MLIPSIDLKGGRVVQLVQGERLALEDHDLDAWIARFSSFPKVQLIDLDAAMGTGNNDALVKRVAAALPVRVGGGVRTIARAEELLAAGAHAVIVGSSLFKSGGSKDPPLRTIGQHTIGQHTIGQHTIGQGTIGQPTIEWHTTGQSPSSRRGGSSDPPEIDLRFAETLAGAIGTDRVIAAVDSKAGHVVIHGWKTMLAITAVEAVRALEPFCGEFLYTHVDKEGLMQGTDMPAIRAVRDATTRRVTAAGGITTRDEIDALHGIGVDAVVGMAIYTGRLGLDA